MDYGLAGKVAVVSGGSRGIGRAIATALLDEGRVGGDRRPHGIGAGDGRR